MASVATILLVMLGFYAQQSFTSRSPHPTGTERLLVDIARLPDVHAAHVRRIWTRIAEIEFCGLAVATFAWFLLQRAAARHVG